MPSLPPSSSALLLGEGSAGDRQAQGTGRRKGQAGSGDRQAQAKAGSEETLMWFSGLPQDHSPEAAPGEKAPLSCQNKESTKLLRPGERT